MSYDATMQYCKGKDAPRTPRNTLMLLSRRTSLLALACNVRVIVDRTNVRAIGSTSLRNMSLPALLASNIWLRRRFPTPLPFAAAGRRVETRNLQLLRIWELCETSASGIVIKHIIICLVIRLSSSFAILKRVTLLAD